MIGTRFMAALAAVALGAGLMAAPALAKCSKECKVLIRDTGKEDFTACKDACNANTTANPTKKDKKKCIKALCKPRKARKELKGKCKAATAPVVPSCGSPSGAFVDSSLE